MRKKRFSKKNKQIADEWCKNHGAAEIDLKERDIILPNGGMFCINNKRKKVPKICGYKTLPNGFCKIIFSKKPLVWEDNYEATFWVEDLDEFISYFKSMKRMLNKIGYDTDVSLKWKKELGKEIKKVREGEKKR